MTAPRAQYRLWRRRRSVFILLCDPRRSANRGVTKVPDTLQRWWLYARDLKAVWTDSACLVSTLKLFIIAEQSWSLPERRSEWRLSESRWEKWRCLGVDRAGTRRDRPPARPAGCLFWKSVRTPVISASQQTAMTAADWGGISVSEPAFGPWLDSFDPTWPAKPHRIHFIFVKVLY